MFNGDVQRVSYFLIRVCTCICEHEPLFNSLQLIEYETRYLSSMFCFVKQTLAGYHSRTWNVNKTIVLPAA